ncbi:hypothetical protein [Lysinibacillus sp. 54212]|uniref:hypothetical protein n=1 Tax=Lysinibacillus sp. 54212 TaxID=3119829 RepID=UPI002FCCB1C8
MERDKANGKKVAMIVIGSIIVAAIFVVVVIQIFYATYDPKKYNRNMDESSALSLTEGASPNIIISNSR